MNIKLGVDRAKKIYCNIFMLPLYSGAIRIWHKLMGLTGFDSEMKWFVSMQCIVGWHYNLRRQNFNWRK